MYLINQNIQIIFSIQENLYFRFKDCCLEEKRKPAYVIREMIGNYVAEREYEKKESNRIEAEISKEEGQL